MAEHFKCLRRVLLQSSALIVGGSGGDDARTAADWTEGGHVGQRVEPVRPFPNRIQRGLELGWRVGLRKLAEVDALGRHSGLFVAQQDDGTAQPLSPLKGEYRERCALLRIGGTQQG